jgi:hypothetical protein
VPASRFTSYVAPSHVVSTLSGLGISDIRVSYAQMYSLKQAMNYVSRIEGAEELARRLIALDADVAAAVRRIVSDHDMARLLPSVTVRGIRRAE